MYYKTRYLPSKQQQSSVNILDFLALRLFNILQKVPRPKSFVRVCWFVECKFIPQFFRIWLRSSAVLSITGTICSPVPNVAAKFIHPFNCWICTCKYQTPRCIASTTNWRSRTKPSSWEFAICSSWRFTICSSWRFAICSSWCLTPSSARWRLACSSPRWNWSTNPPITPLWKRIATKTGTCRTKSTSTTCTSPWISSQTCTS